MPPLRVALCQINTVVGDLDGNVERILAALAQAEGAGASLAVFPELALTGYPPEDLVLKPRFVADNEAALEKLAARTGSCAAVVGFVDGQRGGGIYDAAAVCADGEIVGVYHKRLLPNYAVFDERRYFLAGTGPAPVFRVGGHVVGVVVCEDVWFSQGPVTQVAAAGAEIVVSLNASPYFVGRIGDRAEVLRARAAETSLPHVYVNLVGGQDELVFDGGSLVVDGGGDIVLRLPQFTEAVTVVDIDIDIDIDVAVGGGGSVTVVDGPVADGLDHLEEMYDALVLGTRDYVHKNGFSDVVIGFSGGIDSSLVAAIAVDALGSNHVHGVSMPSRFSSEGSRDDAAALAANLAVEYRTVPIEDAHAALLGMLAPSFGGRPPGVAEENLQARVRGTVLMALSNKFGWLLLSTGNKSELAVGYSTLYGDMNGGFNPLKDVYKTRVFALSRWRNEQAGCDLIPQVVIDKPPSAELRPDQRDDDSLPPYEVLDPILVSYVERDMTAAELVEAGHDEEVVRRVVRMVDLAEYKRRQAPPGVRITPKAFGKDRRLPITNAYGA